MTHAIGEVLETLHEAIGRGAYLNFYLAVHTKDDFAVPTLRNLDYGKMKELTKHLNSHSASTPPSTQGESRPPQCPKCHSQAQPSEE